MSPATLLALLWSVSDGAATVTTDSGGATASLEVRASGDCTSRADLVARIAHRSPRIRFIDAGAPVAIRASFAAAAGGGVQTEIVMTEAGEKASVRRLLGRSCSEAANGVALIIAVTLDPAAAIEPAPPPPRETAARPASRSTDGAVSRAPAGRNVSLLATGPASTVAAERAANPSAPAQDEPPTLAKAEEPPEPWVLRRPPPPRPPVEPRTRWGVDLAAQAVSGPAPALMPGVAVYAIAALDRSSLWSPAVVLGAMHVWRSDWPAADSKASFTLDAASVDLCALRLWAAPLEARGCASVLAGVLSASGSDTYAPQRATRPFAATGASAMLAAYLGEHLELSARLAAGWSLVRDSFEFAPTEFYRTTAHTVSGSLGVGVRLP